MRLEMKKFTFSCFAILITLILAVSVIGCAQSETSTTTGPSAAPAVKSATYTNPELGFSCQYPAEWDAEENIMGALVIFAGPMTANDTFMINISIVTEELSEAYTIEEYVRLIELQFENSGNDYVKIQGENIKISGLPAIVQTFTVKVQDFAIKDKQAYFIKDTTAYVITYDTIEESHDKYTDYFDLVINTFKFE